MHYPNPPIKLPASLLYDAAISSGQISPSLTSPVDRAKIMARAVRAWRQSLATLGHDWPDLAPVAAHAMATGFLGYHHKIMSNVQSLAAKLASLSEYRSVGDVSPQTTLIYTRSYIPITTRPYPDGVSLARPDNIFPRAHLGGSDYPPGTVRLASEIVTGIAPAIGKHVSTVVPWPIVLKMAVRATRDNPALAMELVDAITPHNPAPHNPAP